jgi:hypothetical protein
MPMIGTAKQPTRVLFVEIHRNGNVDKRARSCRVGDEALQTLVELQIALRDCQFAVEAIHDDVARAVIQRHRWAVEQVIAAGCEDGFIPEI